MNKLSLLDEAKARQAAITLAKNPVAQQLAQQALADPTVQKIAMEQAQQHVANSFGGQPSSSASSSSIYNLDEQPPPPPSTKQHAKVQRENWKVNEQKMNVKSTQASHPEGNVAPRWIPNLEKNECSRCLANFDWVSRRHHCRKCGHIFCANCTNQKALLPEGTAAKTSDTKNPRRVCHDCFENVKQIQDNLALNQSNSMRENTINSTNRYLNSPIRFTMGAEIRKAAYIIKNFHTGLETKHIEDSSVPLRLIRDACGLAILTVMKVGFFWSGRLGTGLVVARRGDGSWSPPSAIMMAGAGFGAQIGGEVTDVVVVLTSAAAVTAFCSKGSLQLGAEIGVSVGPLGRSAEGAVRAGDKGVSACVSYSHSKGLFAGASIEGAVISQRPDINKKFYGTSKHSPVELLKGNVPPAPAAKPLYDALQGLLDTDPTKALRAGFLNAPGANIGGGGGGFGGGGGGGGGAMGQFGQPRTSGVKRDLVGI